MCVHESCLHVCVCVHAHESYFVCVCVHAQMCLDLCVSVRGSLCERESVCKCERTRELISVYRGLMFRVVHLCILQLQGLLTMYKHFWRTVLILARPGNAVAMVTSLNSL